ncbi:MAG: diguanylate cyclase [Pseudomonadota bacterium]|nr:diguanylate cyclase [Pseudomonadota bacterium]
MAPGEYTIRVLLVDDQAMIGEAVRRALSQQSNIEFHYCNNSAEAFKLAEKIKPTVILQDLVMPGLDGLALVRLYRASPLTKDIPIIVLSTKEDSAVKSEAFALGANDYLIKLPDAVELIARVRHHSQAYLHQLQRDAAYLALRDSQRRLMEINIELQRLTKVDGLTGLSNRRYFDEFLDAQWRLAVRDQQPLSILMIDVDNFKRYNDTYGHLQGDEVLKGVATAMQGSFTRPTDLAARFGGEEFVVILPATPLAPLLSLGENLRRNVEALRIPHSGSSVSEFVTISVGGATATPQSADSFLSLVATADAALYEAKNSGKNKVVTRNHGEAVKTAAGSG